MTGTLTNLLREHERTLVQLTFLNDAVSRIYLQGFSHDDMNVIRASIVYIAKDFNEHCENEESKIYPGLKICLDKESIQELTDEHKKITESLVGFKYILPDINESITNPAGALELKSYTRDFAALFSRHIRKENDCFYIMAQHLLPQKTLMQIFKNRKQK